MSVQLVLGVVGGVVGGAFGYPQLGFALGSLAGAALTPKQKIQGPKLDDLSAPRLQYGQAIPRLYGTHRVSATPIWVSALQPRESTEEVGKGGGQEVTTTTYTVDALFLCSIDSPADGISRVWLNKKLVYSVGPDTTGESRITSDSTTAWGQIGLMDGNPAQVPWATYEAAVGVGNAPAYRHRTCVAIYQLDLGQSGQFPLVEFELFTNGTPATAGYRDNFTDGLDSFTGATSGPYFSAVGTIYGGGIQTNSQGFGGTSQQIAKAITPFSPIGLRIKFYMGAQALDDSGSVGVYDGINLRLGVIPKRESTVDPDERCYAVIQGNALALTAAMLDIFTWYEVQIDILPGTSNSVARLYNLDSNTLLTTTFFTGFSFTPANASRFEISNEGTFGCGDTILADLKLTGAAADFSPVLLQDIVEAEIDRVLDASEFDASDLAGIEVAGYASTQSARGTMEELALLYYFEAFCDDKLRIVRRGGSSLETVPYLLTGAGSDKPTDPFNGMDRADELAVPAFFSMVSPDPTRDYEPQSVMSDRLVTQSKETKQVSTSVVLTPSQAKGRADSIARDTKVASNSWTTSLDLSHIARTPTDPITLTDVDGTTYRSRILRITFSKYICTMEGVLDDANALTEEGVAPPDGAPTIEVDDPGFAVLELVDGPIVRDDDDDPGQYGAVRNSEGIGTTRVFKSTDGVTFNTVVDVPEQAITGVATTELGDVDNPNVWDHANSVTVSVSGTLSASTKDAMQNDGTINVLAIKAGDDWEYIRFADRALVSAGIYTLSTLLRGLRGTERFTGLHAAGDKVVLIRTAGLRRLPGTVGEIGLNRYWKALTFGQNPDTAAVLIAANDAVGLLPFSPAHFRGDRNSSGDILFTWARRTRKQVRYGGPGGTLAPLGEDSESYQIDIYDSGTVVRTISATSESATYTAAQQTTDFGGALGYGNCDAEVFQISATVGRSPGNRRAV